MIPVSCPPKKYLPPPKNRLECLSGTKQKLGFVFFTGRIKTTTDPSGFGDTNHGPTSVTCVVLKDMWSHQLHQKEIQKSAKRGPVSPNVNGYHHEYNIYIYSFIYIYIYVYIYTSPKFNIEPENDCF